MGVNWFDLSEDAFLLTCPNPSLFPIPDHHMPSESPIPPNIGFIQIMNAMNAARTIYFRNELAQRRHERLN
jgi:hypothetical protein